MPYTGHTMTFGNTIKQTLNYGAIFDTSRVLVHTDFLAHKPPAQLVCKNVSIFEKVFSFRMKEH